jgi:WD40 repeat protein
LKQQTALPPALLVLAGGGDPAKAPPELAAVLGDGKYLLPRVGQAAWMENSPDGKLLGVPLDEDVLLFDVMTGAYLRTLKGPGGRVFRVTFSRDSQLLAAITRNEERGGSVQVWDLGANRVLFTNPRPGPAGFCSAAFSGDGERLFTEGNGRVCVWDSRSGARIQEVEIHPQGVGPMCVSPDGRRLAVANFFEGSVKVFDWDGKNLKEVRTLKGHSSLVAGVAFSPNGKFLATGDTDEVKLWKADTLELIRSVKTPAQELAFAPDSQTLFAAATNAQSKPAHKVTRWDVSTWTELPALTVDVSVEPVCAFHCLRRDGKVLFMVSQHAATHVRAIDTGTGKDLNPRIGHVAPLHVVAISPNGRTAASAGEDCVVKLWDLATGRVHHSGNAHTGPVYGLAFSPDGELLASGSRDGTIALWDVARGAVVRALLGHSRSYSRIQFSPDGTTLAAGNDRGTIKTWDVATGQEGRSLPGHSGEVRAVAFSPDGKWLASGGEDRIVRLHELTSGRSRSFQATISVCEIAISPDGRTLAAVGEAPKAGVQLWDGCANSFW